jgi:hypothetical protein
MSGKTSVALVLVSLCVGTLTAVAAPASMEDWKGDTESSQLGIGALMGLGIVDSQTGVAMMGTISKKVLSHGFVPDIANSVSMETQLGPVLRAGEAIFTYSAHLRWDFQKNETWTFYARGGIGGNIETGRTPVYPRTGVGAFWNPGGNFNLRAEISHELIGIGAVLPLF